MRRVRRAGLLLFAAANACHLGSAAARLVLSRAAARDFDSGSISAMFAEYTHTAS